MFLEYAASLEVGEVIVRTTTITITMILMIEEPISDSIFLYTLVTSTPPIIVSVQVNLRKDHYHNRSKIVPTLEKEGEQRGSTHPQTTLGVSVNMFVCSCVAPRRDVMLRY